MTLQIVISLIGGLGGLGGIAAVAAAMVQRRKIRADTADVLTDTALGLVQPLRAELEAVRAELHSVRQEATLLATTLRRWRWAILDPQATLDQLRAMAITEVGHNGGVSIPD